MSGETLKPVTKKPWKTPTLTVYGDLKLTQTKAAGISGGDGGVHPNNKT